ncbi:MAG: hypothetical protein AAF739_13495 [Pseudomonadota bacterium]
MMDAWIKNWTSSSETNVTPWSLMTDTVPSLTDGTPPIWLSTFSAPALMSAAAVSTAGATWLGLWMSTATAPMAAYSALVSAPDAIKPAKVTKKAPANTAAKSATAKTPTPKTPAAKASVSKAPTTKKPVGKTAPVAKSAATKTSAGKPSAAKTTAAKTAAAKSAVAKSAVAKATSTKSTAAKVAPVKAASAKAATKGAQPKKAATKLNDRPSGLDAPRSGGADDLKRISGVGPKLETVLNDLGIYHFDQIASWKKAEIAWVDDYLRFKGRIERDGWIKQAKAFATEAA